MKTPGATAQTAPEKPKVSEALLNAQKLEKRLAGLIGAKSSLLSKSGASAPNEAAGIVAGSVSSAGKGALPSGGFGGDRKVDVGFKNGNLTGSLPSGEKLAGLSVGGASGEGGVSFLSVSGVAGGGPVAEGLTKEEVWAVIRKHLHEIRYCYETSILRNPKLEGKLVVSFVINGTGEVKKPAVKETEMRDQPLDKCVVSRIALWKFPKPKGKINVDVQYPFVFRRL